MSELVTLSVEQLEVKSRCAENKREDYLGGEKFDG